MERRTTNIGGRKKKKQNLEFGEKPKKDFPSKIYSIVFPFFVCLFFFSFSLWGCNNNNA